MNLSVGQTIIVVVCLLTLGVLVALHDVSGDVATPVFSAALAGALGYMNGKRNAANGPG